MRSIETQPGPTVSIAPTSPERQTVKSPEEYERQITGLQERIMMLEKQLAEMGLDSLTGIKNRGTFDEELARDMKIIQGENKEQRAGVETLRQLALLFIDLDKFKEINDALGHAVGDEVLRRVCAKLSSSVRETDTVARYGGDELVIIIRGVDEDWATEKANMLRQEISELEFPNYPDIKITASIGVASSKLAAQPDELCSMADNAMYQAKRGGRNNVISIK